MQIGLRRSVPRDCSTHARTHTETPRAHLLRIVIAIFVVECISRAKTLQSHRNGSAKRPETISRSYHYHSQCCSHSQTVVGKVEIAITVQQMKHAGSWLSRPPLTETRIMWQVRDKGVPSPYHHGRAMSSLEENCQTMHTPPAAIDD